MVLRRTWPLGRDPDKEDRHKSQSPGSGELWQRSGQCRRLRRAGYRCQARVNQHGAETIPHRDRNYFESSSNYMRLFCVAVAGSENMALSVQERLFLNCEGWVVEDKRLAFDKYLIAALSHGERTIKKPRA